MDVPGPGSDALLAQTVQQMKNLELSTMNIVTFKASKEGITLTDNVNGWVWGVRMGVWWGCEWRGWEYVWVEGVGVWWGD